jgi:flavodoxin
MTVKIMYIFAGSKEGNVEIIAATLLQRINGDGDDVIEHQRNCGNL